MARRRRRAGRRRTPWHFLFYEVLGHLIDGELRREVAVGHLPLRIDAVILRGAPATRPAPHFAEMLSRLSPCTLFELKGPGDSLGLGELHHLVGCAVLALGGELADVPHEDVRLHVCAPALTDAFRTDVQRMGGAIVPEGPGVHRVAGLPFPCFVFETEVLGDTDPLMDLFRLKHRSPRGGRVVESELMCYIVDIIRGLSRPAEEAPMTQREAQIMERLRQHAREMILEMTHEEQLELFRRLPVEERLAGIPPAERLAGIPPQERLAGIPPQERLAGIPPQERLAGIPPEDRLAGIPPEDRIRGLSPEEIERLRRLLH
ncbi:MAG: hypothetical protein AMXMBFR64_34000 [Myxococcales bacterium]